MFCKDWIALRDWASEHTACDADDIEGKNDVLYQDLCHNDEDGL